MIILQLDIAAFGKLKDRSIALRPGMNVITGDNESGKTTAAAFIRGMLFGIAAGSPEYGSYLPEEFDGRFGGAMKVLAEGAFYRIERNFLEGEESLRVVKQNDGGEVEDPGKWLSQCLGGVSEENYLRTGYIRQGVLLREIDSYGAAPEKQEEEMQEAELLLQYGQARERLLRQRAAFTDPFDEGIAERLAGVRKELADRKEKAEELRKHLPELTKDLDGKEADLQEDHRRIDAENSGVQEKYLNELKDSKEKLQQSVKKTGTGHRTCRGFATFFLLLSFLLGLAVYFYIYSYKLFLSDIYDLIPPFGKETEWIRFFGIAGALFLFLLGLILAIVSAAGKKKAEKLRKSQEDLRAEAEAAEATYQHYLDHREEMDAQVDHREEREQKIEEMKTEIEELTHTRQENDTEILNLQKEAEELLRKLEKQEADRKEIEAIDLALGAFRKLSEESSESPDEAGTRASSYLRTIDPTKDYRIRITSERAVTVDVGNVRRSVPELSLSVSQEVLLAVRLSLLQEADPDRKLPVILDDVFAGFDESRMRSAMNLLRSLGRQAVLLSCQTREQEKL